VDTGSSAREDWWSVALGLVLLAGAVAGLVGAPPAIGSWETSPLAAVPGSVAAGLLILLVGLGALTAVAVAASGGPWRAYLAGFPLVLGLAVLAKLIGAQATLHAYGLSYALWALALGLLVANTTGTPAWLLAGARSELFIKTGLVVLGAEILAGRIVTLGAPGLLVAYAVTPVVIVFMWRVGTRVLRMASPALVMVIACATSVCGVSAAIAAAAATRAKREELTLAVGMTMIFTVLMMVGMPAISRAIGLTNAVAGAWVGGTVDSTGAVVVAGAMLGAEAEQVAAVVKMIQNTMIGGIAFLIAVYWVTVVERDAGGARPLRRRLARLLLRLRAGAGRAGRHRDHEDHQRAARLALRPGVHGHRSRSGLPQARAPSRGRKADRALRDGTDVQRDPDLDRRPARLRCAGGRRLGS
jgi:uncharacterized membrane protein YadS